MQRQKELLMKKALERYPQDGIYFFAMMDIQH